MSLRGTLALLLLASLMLAPVSNSLAQEVLEPTLPETSQDPVVPEEIPEPPPPEPEEPLVSSEEAPSRTTSDESGDITAPTIMQARTLYNSAERSAGPKSQIEDRTTAINILVSDEMNESPDVRVDFSLLGGSSSVGPNEGISSLFNKYIYYDGPAITVPDGTYSLPYSVSDPHGNIVEGTVPITIDETPPSIENFTVSYAAGKTSATSTDTITLSGSFSDLSSLEATKIFDALLYEYDEAGQPAYFVPTSIGERFVPDARTVSAGTFSLEFPIAPALIDGSFKSNARTFDIVFSVQDGAGLITTATSTRLLIGDSPVATTTSVSNVLFLPGIKGSRLYDDNKKCGVFTCDSKLWDPANNEDIQSLFLNSFGKSIGTGVYVKEGDVIDKVDKKYYASFIEDMNELQASTTYSGGNFKWKAAAYDWRLSLDDIVNNGVERDGKIYYEEASSTSYIEQTLRELAATSTTNKVTIIAHSNGGLVVKALLSKLGAEETARLVDKIIFVGVPQTGAPQALGGLLFGDGEGLPKDKLPFLVTPATARSLAENSPMAYHLMPSARYLSDVQDYNHSIIGFSGEVLYPKERSSYGPSIDTLTELDNFLLAVEGGRTKPDPSDRASANVLNSFLIDYANNTHDALDAWVPPAGVTLYQIAGWGANTISGIDFYDEQKLFGATIGHKKQYRPLFVEDGDGVVPVPSALMMSEGENVKKYWLNLQEAKNGLQKFDHGNIFEVENVRIFLENIFNDRATEIPQFISTDQPPTTNVAKKLLFILHSPLTLGLYQNENHTGINEDGTVDEEIPDVEYGEFGEVKYILAPAGQQYELKMQGLSSGEFSLDIQELTGNTVSSSATIADIPTTASTVATLTITNGISDASSLKVDGDGNGSTDIDISPEQGETVLYSPSLSTEATTPESGSGHSSAVTSPSISIEEDAPVEEILAVVSDTPLVAMIPPAKTQLSETETPEVNVVSQEDVDQTQTASAYDAVGGKVIQWFETLLYNIWRTVISFISGLIKE